MPPHSEPPVVIVGAGVAGLACAQDLVVAGVPVQILEGSNGVGGRMRTDRRDGLLLDRGFQVFNTSSAGETADQPARAAAAAVHPGSTAAHRRPPPAVRRSDATAQRRSRPVAGPPGRAV